MLEFFFRKRRGLLLLVLLGLAAGLFLLPQIPIKLYPNTMKPVISVYIPHPGYTAEDFHGQFSSTLEPRISGIQDVERVEVSYSNGQTRLRIEFKWEVDYDEAYLRVDNTMASLRNSLPEDSRNYSVRSWTGDNTGFLSIAVSSSVLPPRDLFLLLESVLKPELAKIEDAESVDMINIEELRASVTLDSNLLLEYSLTPDTILSAVRNGYKPEPVGSFESQGERFNVRLMKGIDSIFEINKIVISSSGGRTIYLEDVADIEVKYDLPRMLFRSNGERAIMIFASPKEGGNIKKMSEDVQKTINQVKLNLPEHVTFHYLVDPALFINRAIGNVLKSALIGASLAVFCVLLLLGEVRNTFLISLSIPLSITLSFILMYVFDLSINLISLGGMTLSVGMIIDSSIVVMENIHRHRKENLEAKTKKNLKTVITESIKEVRAAVFASTLTSVLVFLPLSFTAPLANAILGDLAKVVVYTLSSSLLVALFVTPVAAYYLFRKGYARGYKKPGLLTKFSVALMGFFRRIYIAVLRRLLASKVASFVFIIFSIALLVSGIIKLVPEIKTEIIAEPESDKITFMVVKYGVEDKEQMLEEIEPFEKELLTNYPGKVASIFAQVVRDNAASFIISLTESRYLQEVMEDLRIRYISSTDWRFNVMPWDPAQLPLPMTRDLHIRITGPEKQEVLGIMERIADLLRGADLYRNIFTDPSTQTAEEIAIFLREEVSSIIPQSRLISSARFLLGGSTALEMIEKGNTIQVRMSFPSDSVTSLQDFENYLFPFRGKGIPLSHFFLTERRRGVQSILSVDGEESFNIYARMKLETPASQRESLEEQARVIISQEITLPPGYGLVFENTQAVVDENIRSLLIALGASLCLIYLVLGIQFNSLRIPLIILVTVPLGLTGVILSLYLFKSTLSLNSLLGAILLGGIVVNNAIIYIDFFFQAISSGMDHREALLKSADLRFTPIIITMTTTILGMLPIALALGDGTNIIQPLGIAVSGGLLVSTLFTLFMVPTILNLLKIGSKKEKPYE